MIHRFHPLAPMLFCQLTSICSANTFNYSLNCPALTVGPDTILAVSDSGTLTLTPNQQLMANELHPLKLTSLPVASVSTNPFATFTGVLSCQFTLNGQTVPLNHSVTMTVTYDRLTSLATPVEQHEYVFQSVSTTASAGAEGVVTISEGELDFTSLGGIITDLRTTLLLTPAQPSAAPIPSSFGLTFMGLAGVVLYYAIRNSRLPVKQVNDSTR